MKRLRIGMPDAAEMFRREVDEKSLGYREREEFSRMTDELHRLRKAE